MDPDQLIVLKGLEGHRPVEPASPLARQVAGHVATAYWVLWFGILAFALIYEGAANWAAANGIATLYPAHGPQVQVHLDDPRDGARICAIAMLENNGTDLVVRREVNYLNGAQRALDEAYGWGMRWTAGRK